MMESFGLDAEEPESDEEMLDLCHDQVKFPFNCAEVQPQAYVKKTKMSETRSKKAKHEQSKKEHTRRRENRKFRIKVVPDFESFKDDLERWGDLTERIQRKIIAAALQKHRFVRCLQRDCRKKLGSVEIVFLHLQRHRRDPHPVRIQRPKLVHDLLTPSLTTGSNSGIASYVAFGKSDSKEQQITAIAKDELKFESFRGDLQRWNGLDRKIQRTIVSAALRRTGFVQCLLSNCDKKFSRSPSIFLHLNRHLKDAHIVENNDREHLSDLLTPSLLTGAHPGIAFNVALDESVSKEQRFFSRTEDEPEFESFRDDLQKWNDLDREIQRKIVASTLRKHDFVQCLLSDCGKNFARSAGLFLHLKWHLREAHLLGSNHSEELSDRLMPTVSTEANRHSSSDLIPVETLAKKQSRSCSATEVEAEYESFRDDLERWGNLTRRTQRKIIEVAMSKYRVIRCLLSQCGKNLHSSPGMFLHLERHCNDPRPFRPKRPEMLSEMFFPAGETASCSAAVSDTSFDKSDFKEQPILEKYEKIKPQKAVEVYLSYRGRIKEWRLLSTLQRNRILRSTWKIRPKMRCLTEGCHVTLSTYNGMAYHLMLCGIPFEKRLMRCKECDEQMPYLNMRLHLFEKHRDMLRGIVSHKWNEDENESAEQGAEKSPKSERSLLNDESILLNIGSRRIRHLRTYNIAQWSEKISEDWNKFVAENYFKCSSLFPEFIARRSHWKTQESHPSECLLSKHSIAVSFGNDTAPKQFSMFETVGHVNGVAGFCGAAILSVAWCPNNGGIQYILVSLRNDRGLTFSLDPVSDVLQLWSFDAAAFANTASTAASAEHFRICMVFTHKQDHINDISWCPSGMWQDPSPNDQTAPIGEGDELPRLGVFAAASDDGSVLIYSLPHPQFLGIEFSQSPLIHTLEPVAVLLSPCQKPVDSVDWSPFKGHSWVAAGFRSGLLCTWNIASRWQQGESSMTMEPYLCSCVADSSIRSVYWFTESIILFSSRNGDAVMWDMLEDVCFRKWPFYYTLHTVFTVPTLFPGFLYSLEEDGYHLGDSVRFLFATTEPDYDSQPQRMTVSSLNDVVWKFSFFPPHAAIMSVDESGRVVASCFSFLGNRQQNMRLASKLVFNTVKLKSPLTVDSATPGSTSEREPSLNALKFVFLPKQAASRLKTQAHKKSYPFGLRQAAIFAVDSNKYIADQHWCCFGGHNGILHVVFLKPF
ncbi:unnamed protein product [Soboliphyme baturini]|uniref:C2H2-type domain-containing protein n=1 Tax=Soboliphyme baturini TaxID=241478 RepID=A0A183J7W5_9BILA|nr:unnamed protein product [Soboliphyme baturini]